MGKNAGLKMPSHYLASSPRCWFLTTESIISKDIIRKARLNNIRLSHKVYYAMDNPALYHKSSMTLNYCGKLGIFWVTISILSFLMERGRFELLERT